jgi:hypothetical protein
VVFGEEEEEESKVFLVNSGQKKEDHSAPKENK